MINILIIHKDKKEFREDIETIKKVFNVLEISNTKKYKDKYYIEIEAIRK
ncbi:hypothetical protein [Clostridium baratii]|nr:hypothetical protein [Clostridium baratii]